MKSLGSAIISALFIMILVSIAATAMSLKLQIDISRTDLIKSTAAMHREAKKSTLIAMSNLGARLGKFSKTKQFVDGGPNYFVGTNDEAIKVTTHIADLQGRFNLNNLKNPKSIRSFAQLLLLVSPDMNVGQALHISEAVADWVKPYNHNRGQTALAKYYLSKHINEPHMPMASVSEFRLIKDVSQKLYLRMQPYLSALPEETAVNLNTASIPVLQTLGAGMSIKTAKSIVKGRGKNGYLTIKEFMNTEAAKTIQLGRNYKGYTLTSQYFLVSAKATKGDDSFVLFSQVKRNRRRKKVSTSVVTQSINTL